MIQIKRSIIILFYIFNLISFNTYKFLPPTVTRSHKFSCEFDNKYPLETEYAIESQHKSLLDGNWVKFICGASNQDIPLIRNLCYIYTLCGVDCIDFSADPSVIDAANDGIYHAIQKNPLIRKPYLMISINDDDDLHFRKAYFNPQLCPVNCTRPCEKVI